MGDTLAAWRQGIGTMAGRLASPGWRERCGETVVAPGVAGEGAAGVVTVLCLLLLAGDVERNPGPTCGTVTQPLHPSSSPGRLPG
jgi:hypothetical protein